MTDLQTSWPPTFPCTIVHEWKCPDCGQYHTYRFESSEPGDDNYDGFDFYCDCGRYFKKFARVPSECVTRTGWLPQYGSGSHELKS